MLNQKEITNIKKHFLSIAKTDNPSGNEGHVVVWVLAFLKKMKIVPNVDLKNNIFFKIDGVGEPLLLCAHLDSVSPCLNKEPIFDGKKFTSSGETILGADDLGGIIVILETIVFLKKHKIEHRPLEILFTTMEEVGGEGIKKFDFSQLNSKESVVVDSIAPLGSVVIRSPSKYNFSFFIQGKSAHGSKASEGLSAIFIMAELISALPVGQINPNTFLNIGKIEGGKAINSVPESAQISGAIKIYSEGEIRGMSNDCQEVIDLIFKGIKALEKKYPKSKIDFDYNLVRGGYSFNSKNDLVLNVIESIKLSGLKPKTVESFGCSDANTLNAMGHEAVLLGMGISGAHTIDESIELKSLLKLTEILVNFSKTSSGLKKK